MTYIHIVRPFYIDNELQVKKIEILLDDDQRLKKQISDLKESIFSL